jgi:hypothetical protein
MEIDSIDLYDTFLILYGISTVYNYLFYMILDNIKYVKLVSLCINYGY